ncbi:Uncharacterized protein dnm_033400 [Desulfonema magnum]|uniref:Uncharacterized protein n=1 Tax=Desulfonema magnum TaxID=45655 RepID=A0A975BLG1_9BACT|nr:Uncharacterized protein dnm_033400 [Desulfonema magnum]
MKFEWNDQKESINIQKHHRNWGPELGSDHAIFLKSYWQESDKPHFLPLNNLF